MLFWTTTPSPSFSHTRPEYPVEKIVSIRWNMFGEVLSRYSSLMLKVVDERCKHLFHVHNYMRRNDASLVRMLQGLKSFSRWVLPWIHLVRLVHSNVAAIQIPFHPYSASYFQDFLIFCSWYMTYEGILHNGALLQRTLYVSLNPTKYI